MRGESARQVRRVLLVDDYELQLKYWQRDLERLGIESTAVTRRSHALAAARTSEYQLSVIDLSLGLDVDGYGGSGLNVIEDLLKIDPTINPILVSADLPKQHAVYAMRSGALWATNKPLDWREAIALAEGRKPRMPTLDEQALDYDTQVKGILERALDAEQGNKTRTAARLGLRRESLRRKLDKAGVKRPVARKIRGGDNRLGVSRACTQPLNVERP